MTIPRADTPMMRQFNAIKREHPDKILFYRMGDFYEMFGDDAVIGAKVLQIALTSRDKKSKNAVPMCGVPYRAYEQYLNKLTAAGYKVAICEQMEDPAKAKGLVARDIVRVVTPGTTVSPHLIDPDHNHYLLALCWSPRAHQLGAAFADISTGEFEVCEFPQAELQRFYDFTAQLLPSEVLLAKSRSETETRFLEELTTRMTLLLENGTSEVVENQPHSKRFNFVDPYYFDFDAASRRFREHFQTHNLAGFGIEHLPHGISAAGALLRYLEETQKCDLVHLTSVHQHTFDQVMLLDESTVTNLELFENQSGQRRHTLYGVMNQTRTPMGARLLRRWIRRPLLEVDLINERLCGIDAFRENFMLCEEFRERLKKIQDLPRIISRISLPVAGIADMTALRESLRPLQELPRYLGEFDSPLIRELACNFDPLPDILELLMSRLQENPSIRLREGGFIADGVSSELDELRTMALNSKQYLNDMLLREKDRTGIGSLKIGFNKVFGYYMEVSNAHKISVPEDYIRKQTLVNAERYITPELKEFEEKILTAEERIAELEYKLFLDLKEQLIQETERVQQTAKTIAVADVISGWAHLAEHQHYTKPVLRSLNAPRYMHFKGSRHPVIEQIDFDEVFVPNDLELDEVARRIMLITGPNMAGKSTFMRQVALNVLMAQCGCCIPADYGEFSLVDRIFTRVGASDNLSLGQSTFMMEMNEVSAILHNASELSLVILDEVGRGTSTFDGISIAWAIVEHLHTLGSLTLCATHYHELTALSQELESVENFSMRVEEEGEKIVFLRKIIPGEANKSYGVQVARLAGLPVSVVRRAKEMMVQLEDNSVIHNMPVPPATGLESAGHLESAPESVEDNKEKPQWFGQPVRQKGIQLSLFPEEHALAEELRRLKLDRMTPIEAMNYLHELVTRFHAQNP